MNQPYFLFVPLDQVIEVFLNDCMKRKMQNHYRDISRAKIDGINVKIEWVPLFSELSKEIFAKAETFRSPSTLPPSVSILMGLGYDRKEALTLSKQLFAQILEEIALVSPDFQIGELEEWNYGICEPNTLMISVPSN